jgi:CheY-like chemotaxis protein
MYARLAATEDDLAMGLSPPFTRHTAHRGVDTYNCAMMTGTDDDTATGTGGPMPDEEGSDVLAPIRILIVEDEALVAMDLGFRLEDLGYAICGTAATADQAVALAETQNPDLILMDVNLHGSRDGVEAAADIRRKDPHARIIFVTAYSDPSTRDRMAKAGGLGVVAKPYTDHEVAQAIEHAMAKRSEQ